MKTHQSGAASTAAPAKSRSKSSLQTRKNLVQTRHRRLFLTMALVLVTLAALVRVLNDSPSFQEWRFARMSLPALQRFRGSRTDNPRLLYYIGLRLNQQQRFSEADGYLRQAVGLDPNSSKYRDEWARALLGSGLVKAAFGELREFAGTHPSLASAHFLLGKFYVTQHSMLRANDELTHAVTLEPSMAEGWYYLAMARAEADQIGLAQTAAQKAVALRPKNALYTFYLATLLAQSGLPDQTRHAFVQAITLEPRSAEAHREYARWLLAANAMPQDQTLAVTEARRAVTLAPNDAGAQIVLGRALLLSEQPQEAVVPLLQGVQMDPKDPAPALALSQAYRKIGQTKSADTWRQVSLKRQQDAATEYSLITPVTQHPDDPKPRLRLARFLAQQGDVLGCLSNHASAAHCAPDAPPALVGAAIDLTAAGRAADALPLAKRAVGLTASNPLAREALADAQLALGQLKEAAASYDQAATWMPERLPNYKHRITLYIQKHRSTLSQLN